MREKLKQFIEAGCSSYTIAKTLSISPSQVRRLLKRHGLKTRCKSGPIPKTPEKMCLACNKRLSNRQNICCDRQCSTRFKRDNYITQWRSGKKPYNKLIRQYLFQKYNFACQICRWSIINQFTKLIPLTVHHIDGNDKNSHESNLQLLCPNCHALTHNYGSRNKFRDVALDAAPPSKRMGAGSIPAVPTMMIPDEPTDGTPPSKRSLWGSTPHVGSISRLDTMIEIV